MEAGWYLIVLATAVTPVKTAVIINFVSKTCDQSNTFLQTFGGSLQDCIDECDRRSRCKAIMFRRGMNHCSLKSNVGIISLNDAEPRCMYLKTSDWEASDLGPCNKSTCGETEKCVTSKRNLEKFSCLKSECRLPSNITHAYLLSDKQTIGSINKYKCESGYMGYGASSITCKHDATWSTTTFYCLKICQKPKTVYNGALSCVEKTGIFLSDGTDILFTCGKDFQVNGPVFFSTCRNGVWSPNRVQCCDNGTELWPWWFRCTFYTGLVSSKTHANDICSEKGYHTANINANVAMKMIERYGENDLWLLNSETKTDLTNHFNFTKCLESRNVTNASQYEHFTYDEMVDFIRNQTLTGWECDKINVWAPGQPDGGDDEICIARGKEYNYFMFDIPCFNLQSSTVGAVCYKDLPVI